MENKSQAPLAKALTDEHHEIDGSIEAFIENVSKTPEEGSFLEWADPLRRAMDALRRHIYLEEEFVFPPLNTGGLVMAIMVMYREHGEIWRAMDRLDEMFETGEGDPVAECRAMLEVLEKHNEKEEPVIYPHLDTQLAPDLQLKLQEFIDSGTMPEGWVCRAA